MDSLQYILTIGIIAMAIINAVSLVWAFYLEGKLRRGPTPRTYDVHIDGTKLFTEEDLKQARELAKKEMVRNVTVAAEQLQHSLAASADEIAVHLNDKSNDSLNQELEKYRITLGELHTQAIKQFGQLQQEIDQQRDKLIAQLDADVAQEQERRIDHFNERINDVVASYLAETLGEGVDLGAQGAYILQTLQQHKEDIKRDVLS